MKTINWLKSRLSRSGNALLLHRWVMAKHKNHCHADVIRDSTAAIDSPDAPASVKSMALYNRALACVENGDFTEGADDLEAVLAMEDAPSKIKRMAAQKLAKRESRYHRSKA